MSLAQLLMLSLSANAQITEGEWESLNRGRVLSAWVASAEGVPGIRVSFVIDASRERIWEVLVDYDNYTSIFDGIKDMRVTDQTPSGAKVEFWIDAVLRELHYVLYREYVEPRYELTWKQLSGDLKDIHGSWEIEDTDDPQKKLLVYDSYVDVGFPIRTWLVRLVAGIKAKRMARKLRDWIEQPARENP